MDSQKMTEIEQAIADKKLELAKIEEERKSEEELKSQSSNVVISENDDQNFVAIKDDNALVAALVNNDAAVDIARQKYQDQKNQKSIANKMGKVVNRKTNADIETANIKVEEQEKNNRVKKQEIRNELLKLKNDKTYLKKEHKHRLEMQRARHLREKYEDLLLRTCRKKQKGEDKKWHYVNDKEGNPIVNIPGKVRFFFIRLFDGIVSGLNQIADILGAINKGVLKGSLIILILLLLIVAPFRNWLLGLIGIHLG